MIGGLGLHSAGGPLALFFREPLLLEETPVACSGMWAPQVLFSTLCFGVPESPPSLTSLTLFGSLQSGW